MNVLVLSPGADTGGQGIRIKRAFDKFGRRTTVRAMCTSKSFLDHAIDAPYSPAEAARLYKWADVVHHKNSLHLYGKLDAGQRKPAILHHQGTRLRNHADVVGDEGQSIGAVPLVSTVDLRLSLSFPSTWLPTPYDLDGLAKAYRRTTRLSPRLRIVQAPTNRAVKSTDLILGVLNDLSRKYDIEVDVIEKVSWKVCMARKGRADIFIDQLNLGYGNNAVEAWAMGIPVVCGVADPAVRALMIETWGELPFYEASAATLELRLSQLIESRSLREEWGERGRAHAERWHSEEQVVRLLSGIYSEAKPTRGAEHLRLAEVVAPAMVAENRGKVLI